MRDYLGRLSGNLGGNMRECLAEGLTVNENQDTADNLTTYGGILDSRDFRRMRNRFQCFPLVFNWIRDLALVAGSAGVRAREFFEGEHYLRLATAFLGREAGARATEGVKRCQRADKLPGYAAMDLARRWVSASLVRDKREITPEYLATQFKHHPALSEYLGIASKVSDFCQVLERKLMSVTMAFPDEINRMPGIHESTFPRVYNARDLTWIYGKGFIYWAFEREAPKLEHGVEQESRDLMTPLAEPPLTAAGRHDLERKNKKRRR
jgi:hypothetical protein